MLFNKSVSLLIVFFCILIWKCNGERNDEEEQEQEDEIMFNCDFEVDLYNCVNINCKGLKQIDKIPLSISHLVNFKLSKNQLLCSIDLSETGIEHIDSYSMENINELYDQLISFNIEHSKNVIKILLSNIKSIESFSLDNTNIVLLIRDSQIKSVEPKSLKSSSHKVDISLINTTLNSVDWLNLLDSTSLKLFSIRSIPNLNSLFNDERIFMFPITTITDLKVYNSYLPVLEENFFLFKILKYVEQIEITNCSIQSIRDKIFNKITFSYLRILSLANNNITRISVNTFSGLNELVILDLDENPIQIIEANAFDNLKKLKTLSINNNFKLINLIRHFQFNNWFNGLIFNNLIRDSSLIEISLKNKFWIEDFCLIQDIFLRLNKNLISNNLNDHDENSSNEAFLTENKNQIRRLYLFNEDQIDILINNINYCNIKFICANLKNLYWKLEVYNLCIKIKAKKIQFDCLYYKMSYECSLSFNSGSHASKYELVSRNTTYTSHLKEACLNSSAVFAKIKWVSFIIFAVIVFLIGLTLVFFYYSFKSSKALYEECELKKPTQQSINSMNTLTKSSYANNADSAKPYGVNNSEYYVLLVNKNPINEI